jgi:hypothetical protein
MVQLSAIRCSCIAVSQCSEFCRHNPSCCFSTSVYCCLFRYDSVRKLLVTWERGDIASLILNLGTRWKSMVSFTHRLLWPQVKGPLFCGIGGEEKKVDFFYSWRESNSDRPVRSLVTVLTEIWNVLVRGKYHALACVISVHAATIMFMSNRCEHMCLFST